MTVHAPLPDYAAARRAMVDSQLRPQGVSDPSVIAAMSEVARENFVPKAQRPLAYIDQAVPLGEGRALPAPAVLGQLLNALAPLSGERALVVGASTGYAAAVLGAMGVEVGTVEISNGSLQLGQGEIASYDIVLIDGAVEYVPDALVEQLKDGGRLGAAIVVQGITRLIAGRRAGGGFGYVTIADAATPILPGFQRPRAFTF